MEANSCDFLGLSFMVTRQLLRLSLVSALKEGRMEGETGLCQPHLSTWIRKTTFSFLDLYPLPAYLTRTGSCGRPQLRGKLGK